MISYDEALARILAETCRLPTEDVELADCVGRVLADDIVCREPIPAFDYSAMDGYAFVFAELPTGDRSRLAVMGVSRPGGAVLEKIEPLTACRIFTGAPVPPPADTVVAQEDVEKVGPGEQIVFLRAPKYRQHVRRRGEDLQEGSVALAKGVRLGTQHVGLCAALDQARISVARKPRVTILTTGDELRLAGSKVFPGSVVDGNGPMICALVKDCGGLAEHRHAADEMGAVREEIRRALERSDLLLTIGGISVGSHDHVRTALEAEGVELDFWKVAIRPGKPVAYGRHGDVRVLGLPGNPAAAFVTATIFAAPLLRAMQGNVSVRPKWIAARAAHEMRLPEGRAEFARAKVEFDEDGRVFVSLFSQQASGSTVGIARANALAWLEGPGGTLEKGGKLRVLLLD